MSLSSLADHSLLSNFPLIKLDFRLLTLHLPSKVPKFRHLRLIELFVASEQDPVATYCSGIELLTL